MKKFTVFIGFLCMLFQAIAQTPSFVWGRQTGSTSDDEGVALAVDADGNAYYTGVFNGTVDFDPGPGIVNLTATSTDAYVAKMSSSGQLLWAKGFGGADLDVGAQIATDGFGNVYVSGWYKGTVDFDPGAGVYSLASAGDYDIFIVHFDSTGNFVWAKSMGGADMDQPTAIATDSQGNIYLAGLFRGDLYIDTGSQRKTVSSNGDFDVLLTKFNSNGQLQWAGNQGGTLADYSYDIKPTASGVYTLVSIRGQADMDPWGTYNLTSSGGLDICVTKLDTNGSFIWAEQIGGPFNDEAFGMHIDNSENMYLTGYFKGTVDFDPGSSVNTLSASSGNDEMFIVKLDSGFNLRWAKMQSGGTNSYPMAITADASGNVYSTGFYSGTVDFDPSSNTYDLTASNFDIYISILNASGELAWAGSFGNEQGDWGRDIAVDVSSNLYVLGLFYGDTIDFDPTSGVADLISAGDNDIFLIKLDPGTVLNTGNLPLNDDGAKVYPNPVSNNFTVILKQPYHHVKVELYNSLGALVYSAQAVEPSITVNVADYPAGLYSVRVIDNNGVIASQKIIKQ